MKRGIREIAKDTKQRFPKTWEALDDKAPPPEAEMVERVARAMWEDAEVRAMRSPWVMPTSFEDNADRYRALARAALSSLGQQRMREALEPFAKAADYYDEKFSDWGESEGPYLDTMVAGPAGIKVEHYRKARQALAEEATEQARTGGEIKG